MHIEERTHTHHKWNLIQFNRREKREGPSHIPNARQNGKKEMSGFAASAASAACTLIFTASTATNFRGSTFLVNHNPNANANYASPLYIRNIKFLARVSNESNKRDEVSPDEVSENTDADKIVDGIDFGQLCNEFECISSPSVEATARQLARDILDLRQGNRALGTFAVSVQYKDPVRSFTGRDMYKRPLWATNALDKPTVSVQEMVMLSTSVLSIKWTLKGKPKSVLANIGGDLIIKVHSKFTLNQISGQVIEHEESWDLSESSFPAQAFFWASRRIFATFEAAKDVSDFTKDFTTKFTAENKNIEIYPDPSGDPTKFFQSDEGFQRDAYQFALFVAVLYLVVQFLKTTL